MYFCKVSSFNSSNFLRFSAAPPFSDKSKIDDETGQVSDEFNLRAIAAKCPDYEAEESYVEFLIKEKGGLVLKTPKCHPEIAGQGIEYSNGKAKYHFRKFKVRYRQAPTKSRGSSPQI